MANKVTNSKPGPNGSRLLYDKKGRYVGRSVKNAAGNQVFLDDKGNYAGRCKSGPGNHVIVVPENGASETGSAGGHPGAGPSISFGVWGFAVVSVLFLIIGGLSACCLCFDLRWGLDVSFLEVAGTLLGALTLAADILLIVDLGKNKGKESPSPDAQKKNQPAAMK